MTTMNPHNADNVSSKPLWARYRHGHHWKNAAEEFDGSKLGFWLFLATEVLLFAGIFVAYAIFRAKYPEAWAEGSSLLDWKIGCANTVVLLISSFTMAYSIYCFQTDKIKKGQQMLLITFVFGALFLVLKLSLEYMPKMTGYFLAFDPALSHYSDLVLADHAKFGGLLQYVDGYGGKAPGKFFTHAFATDLNMPLWWGVYYTGTAIHALHVVIGMAMIARSYFRSFKGYYGSGHYTFVEFTGLYWHLVDLVWIFLFPLLYLIH
jgi:cytochrome c oxidase subunit III